MSITLEEFKKRLSEADGRMAWNIRQVLLKQSLRMEADAKRNATYFPRVQTGRLRNSIMGGVLRTQGGLALSLRAGGLSVPSRPFEESADVVYAAIQEFGGGDQNIKEKRYLRNAFEKHLPRTERLLDKAVVSALKGKDL